MLRAMDEIQLTEMTENNLLSKYIRLLEALKKEITYFSPCYLMIQEFISLAKVIHLCSVLYMVWQAVKSFILVLFHAFSQLAIMIQHKQPMFVIL